MFLGAYHFTGDAAALLEGYALLCAEYPPALLQLQVCVQTPDGITVYDACPSEEVFARFSSSGHFLAVVAQAGLPVPRVEPLGEVRNVVASQEGAGQSARRSSA